MNSSPLVTRGRLLVPESAFFLWTSLASSLPPILDDSTNISLLCGSFLSSLSPLSWQWVPSRCFDYSTCHLVLWWPLEGSIMSSGSSALSSLNFSYLVEGLTHGRCSINAFWISLYSIRWLLYWEAGVLGQCNQDTRELHSIHLLFIFKIPMQDWHPAVWSWCGYIGPSSNTDLLCNKSCTWGGKFFLYPLSFS